MIWLLLGCGGGGLSFGDFEVAAEALCGAPTSASVTTLRWVGETNTDLSFQVLKGSRAALGERFDVVLHGSLPAESQRYTISTDDWGYLSFSTGDLPTSSDGLWGIVFYEEGGSAPIGELQLQALSRGTPAVLCAGHLDAQGGLAPAIPLADGFITLAGWTHGAAELDLMMGIYSWEQALLGGDAYEIAVDAGQVSASEQAAVTLPLVFSGDPAELTIFGQAWLQDPSTGAHVGDVLSFEANFEERGGLSLRR